MNARVWLAAAALCVAGCRSGDPSLYPPRPADPPAEAIVLDNHWHTGLIFRTADLPADVLSQIGPYADCRYVVLGWGDDGFFRAEHVTPALVLQALFASRGCVLLVSGFDVEPEAAYAASVDVYRIPITRAGLARIIAHAAAGFRRTDDGHLIDAGPGIDNGRFYAATGRYAWNHTCNQWTAAALANGGLPITPAFAATAWNVEFQLGLLPDVLRNGLAIPRPRSFDSARFRATRGGRP